MTAVEAVPATKRPAVISALAPSWRVPIVLGVFAVIAIILFIVFGRSGQATFILSNTDKGAIQLPNIALSSRVLGIVVAIIAVLMAGGSLWWASRKQKTPLWYLAIFSLALVIGFLGWATSGSDGLPIAVLLAGTVGLSIPFIFGALGGVVTERVGVVNVAIEGQLLAGAFVSAVVASVTKSLAAGVISAMIAGMLVAFVLAAFSIKYFVDQVIVGVVLSGLVLGLTSFLYSTVLNSNTPLFNTPPHFDPIAIPLLSQIPLIGPALFDQTIIVYLMYVAVAAVYYALFHTRWGLRVRAVGEHPQAADTVGINVRRTRFWTVSIAGAIAGLGGVFFTLGSGLGFTTNMTSGDGYIALAAVIFGRWNPIRATLAAVLFGFCTELQYQLAQLGSPIPSDFLLMLPYLVTIFAVAGLVGHVRGPAASGRPYIKS